jgi:hypothetical protein
MATDPTDLASAQRSYNLRMARLQRAEQKLTEASEALTQLFDLTFAHPDAARTKFSELVQKRGLKYAVSKMASKPTDVVPQWKALRGKHTILTGPTRERESARENLIQLTHSYRHVEEAQREKLLAERLFQTAQANLQHQQDNQPVIKKESDRQTRKVGQRKRPKQTL